MVSFTEYRLFGEGAAGSPVDGKGECMTFANRSDCAALGRILKGAKPADL